MQPSKKFWVCMGAGQGTMGKEKLSVDCVSVIPTLSRLRQEDCINYNYC